MYIVNQPWDGRGQRMGDYITRLLIQDQPRFEIFRACVAFVKASGMLRLAPSLQVFMERGGRVEVVAGLDEGITTRQGLELVKRYSTVAYVFSNPVATFHPKMYIFEIPQQQAVAFVGSSNLTSGGLYTNYEANLGIELDLTITADQEIYHSVLSVFLNASDVATGNAKELDATVLEELIRTGKVTDERRPTTSRGNRKRVGEAEHPLFPRTPVPPAPRIAPHLAQLIPKVKPTGDAEAVQEAITALKPWEMFVMVLGPRDTRQESGYSRDVYIPLAARKHSPQFWGWPSQFRPGSITTIGSYTERRVDMLIRPATGQVQVAEGVRLYHYDIKDEFRLNCGRLIEGAKPGDLLVIQKSPVGTLFDGRTYEFEATVIGTLHPEYEALKKECHNRVRGSLHKQWGYA